MKPIRTTILITICFLAFSAIAYSMPAENVETVNNEDYFPTKLILVDSEYTVIGSTNWSYSALTKNNETSVIIKSRETAKSYLVYFNKVMLSCAHEN